MLHQKEKGNLPGRILRIAGRSLLVIILTVVLIAAFLMGVMAIVVHGPSPAAQRLFVLSTKETSAIGFLPHIFLSDEEIEEILHPTPVETEPEPVDTFVELSFEDGTTSESTQETVSVDSSGNVNSDASIEMVDIKKALFNGKMLIIPDPSKVIIGTLDNYSYNNGGMYLYEFIEKYGAIGGTNAGGFYDPNGGGNGGVPGYNNNPDGLVIRDGSIVWGSAGSYYTGVIGFDANNVLHVGNMTGQEALNLGMVSACNFQPGPVLVKDGVKQTGLGGGVNPRTCIGQREDGTILLMVIMGRKTSSLGATYDDLADIMYEYGAVNASNLDGGSSSLMYYQGEQVTEGSNLIGMRPLPTSILVLE